MSEKPILFTGQMVRSILEGRKTQTRRVIKWPMKDINFGCELAPNELSDADVETLCPYGIPGDRLWVRETFQFVHANSDGQRNTFSSAAPFTKNDYRWIEYAATPKDKEPPPKWKPSIFMPRWASRITLEITRVRVERLQDISAADAIAEGIQNDESQLRETPNFRELWDSINRKKHPWKNNPWVWCLSFKLL